MNDKTIFNEEMIAFCMEASRKKACVVDRAKSNNSHQIEGLKLARFLVEVQGDICRIHERLAYAIGAVIGAAATIIVQAIWW